MKQVKSVTHTHTKEIFCMFWRCRIVQHLCLMFETFVNEKLVNVTNMKQNEDFVLFGNRKDFKLDEV